MQMPIYTIASNAGVEGAVVIGKLLEQENSDLGYDAAKGLYSHATTRKLNREVFFCLVSIQVLVASANIDSSIGMLR